MGLDIQDGQHNLQHVCRPDEGLPRIMGCFSSFQLANPVPKYVNGTIPDLGVTNPAQLCQEQASALVPCDRRGSRVAYIELTAIKTVLNIHDAYDSQLGILTTKDFRIPASLCFWLFLGNHISLRTYTGSSFPKWLPSGSRKLLLRKPSPFQS